MANNLSLKRTDRITGSRIAGVLGLSTHKTRADVMREMVREHFWYPDEFGGNIATEFGTEHEPDAISDYELLTGRRVDLTGEKQVTVVGGPNDAFAVTPDGLADDRDGVRAVEAKCPWKARYTSLWERPDYEQQCRLLAELMGVDWVDFVAWRMTGTNITPMQRGVDEQGDAFDWWGSRPSNRYPQIATAGADTVAGEVERFLEEYSRIIELEEDHPILKGYLEGRAGYRYDVEWLNAAATLLELTSEAERIERSVQEAKGELIRLAGNATAKGGGVQAIRRVSAGGGQGSISWKTLAERELAKREVVIDDRMKNEYRGAPSVGGAVGWAFKFLEDDGVVVPEGKGVKA